MIKAALLVSVMFLSLFGKPAFAQSPDGAFAFFFRAIEGGELRLSKFRGKVLLIVNTASQCGFTNQYAGLEQLWQEYGSQGLVVIGVPANDFGAQEPGTEGEIKKFCETNYDVTFPLAAKEKVSGAKAHPFYLWAGAQKKGGLIFSKPRWNFHKYLVGRDGTLIGSYSSGTRPDDESLITAIEAALKAEAP